MPNRIRWKPKYESLVQAHRYDVWFFAGAIVLGILLGASVAMLAGW